MPHRIHPMMAGLMLVASAAGHAMSIGDIEVGSSLGEPLNATVTVRLDESILPQSDCFKLAGAARQHPDLAHAQVTLVVRGDRQLVTITTPGPVYDPLLDISLKTTGCGPTLQRDFVVLLSPRDLPRLQDIPLVARPKAPAADNGGSPKPAMPAGAGDTGAGRKTVHYLLQLDLGYSHFGRMAEKVAKRRQMAYEISKANGAMSPRLKTDIPDPAAKLSGAPAQPAGKPATPAALAAPAATRNQGVAVMPKPAEAGGPAGKDVLVLQPPPESPAASVTTPPDPGQTGVAAGASPDPAYQDVQAGGSRLPARNAGAPVIASAPPADTKPTAPAWKIFAPINLLLLCLLLIFALALALWLKRRTPTSRFMDKTGPRLDALFPADPDDPQPHPLLSRNLPPIGQVFSEPQLPPYHAEQAEETAPAAAEIKRPEPLPEMANLAPEMTPANDFPIEQADSSEHVLELAEVMLAFGRGSQAMETLSQFIRNNAHQAVQPWLKLLDLYHHSGMRAEFEALSTDLHQNFNVAIPDWQTYVEIHGTPGDKPPLDLESFPHIMARLTATWNDPESLAYLDRLLEDNRNGQRLGFSVPIVRDILMLRDVLQQAHLPPAKTSRL